VIQSAEAQVLVAQEPDKSHKAPIFKEVIEELLNYNPSAHEDDWAMYNYLSVQASLKELINRYKSD
jgi:hypothetical protein